MRRVVALAMLSALVGSALAEIKVEEQVAGPGTNRAEHQFTKSATGLHLGAVVMKGSRFVVVVDGVEGPQFEEIYATAPTWQHLPDINGELHNHALQGASPVAFSADGSRYAYCARAQQDVVVISDGNEIFRAPYSPSRPAVALLQFSPGGKHLYFMTSTTDTMYSMSCVMDGVKGPSVAKEVWPVFSADESHWAYYGSKPTPQQEGFVVVDGKVADWTAGRLRYLSDGRLVGVHHPPNQQQQLLVDGKPMLSANLINRIAAGPTGDIYVTATNNAGNMLYLNGQAVSGTEGAYGVTVSPDGKRFAVRCGGGSPPQGWQVIDGKKGQTYGTVSDAIFTADSSKVVYTAEVQNKKFVIADGQESEGFDYMLQPPFVGPAGGKYAYVAGGPMARKPVVDGKVFDAAQKCEGFVFSPDGSRYAFLQSIDLGSMALVVDGEKKECVVRGSEPVFSPDSKHYAVVAFPPKGRATEVMIDGQFLPYPKDVTALRIVGFTPDSKHLVWMGEKQDGKAIVGIDGTIAATFDKLWVGGLRQGMTEISADGTILALGTSSEQAKRVKITPASDTSLETWAADVKAAREQAIADAEKKAADEKAAKEKAAADAKAAQEKAIADRKAALEKKAADRKAAQEKAAADKKAAQEKAAAEKAAKQAAPKPPGN